MTDPNEDTSPPANEHETGDEREPDPHEGDDGGDDDPRGPVEEALLYSASGPRRCPANVVTILQRDARWRGVLAYNEFSGDIVTRTAPPWHEDDAPRSASVGPWVEEDTTRLCNWIAREYDFDVGVDTALAAVCIVSKRNPYHPIRRYLRGLKWDGVERIDGWLVDFCGAADSDYVRAVGSRFLVGAVARVMRPGCKCDSLPILEGDQGAGKSTVWKILAGGDEFFLDSLDVNIGSKDSRDQIRRKWIVELAELDALSRTDVASIKAFLSATTDNYRPSYGRVARDFPRQCVFAGTVNDDGGGYLKDQTGNRRFWPVAVKTIDLERLRATRGMLWAEAVARYDAGAVWYLDDEELRRQHAAEAEARRARDPWEEVIGAWLDEFDRPQRRTQGVTVGEVLKEALDLAPTKMTRADEMRASAVLKRLRWSAAKREDRDGSRVRIYLPDRARSVPSPDRPPSPADQPREPAGGEASGADRRQVGRDRPRRSEVGQAQGSGIAAVIPLPDQPDQPFGGSGDADLNSGGRTPKAAVCEPLQRTPQKVGQVGQRSLRKRSEAGR